MPVALWLALVGCGRQEPPALDTLQSQLLRDSCEALLAGDPERSRQALKRLADTPGGNALATAALERVEHHAALVEINRLLCEGRIEAASRLVREATGPAFRAATQAAPVIGALSALQAYLGQRPFATSEAAESAVRTLNPHRPVLDQSPAFTAFLQSEAAGFVALRQREEDEVVDWLVGELDAAAVSGPAGAASRLAHLTALRPNHMLVKAWAAASVSDIRALDELGRLATRDAAARLGLEAGVCLAWQPMTEAAWRELIPVFITGQPAGLSGQLLQAAANAELGDYRGAVQGLHALAGVTAIDERHVSRLLGRYVLAPRQAQAWCWRTPCPGVSDILACIAQLRTSRPR